VRLDGASDHEVSEALYLHDPDWNGIELYRDRPREDWRPGPDGGVNIVTLPLDLKPLAAETQEAGGPAHADTVMGHVHLRVSDLDRSVAFYPPGYYPHPVGLNPWPSRGGGPPPPGSAGLERFTIESPADGARDLQDPDGIELALQSAQ